LPCPFTRECHCSYQDAIWQLLFCKLSWYRLRSNLLRLLGCRSNLYFSSSLWPFSKRISTFAVHRDQKSQSRKLQQNQERLRQNHQGPI
jgi:hypothetical protein